MSTSKLTGRENLTKYTFWLGPVGPTDKENEVKMYKKYYFIDITSLETVRALIHIKLKSRIQIRISIKVKSRIRICIRRVWIRNTALSKRVLRIETRCTGLKAASPCGLPFLM
jgi:hypothetical protein